MEDLKNTIKDHLEGITIGTGVYIATDDIKLKELEIEIVLEHGNIEYLIVGSITKERTYHREATHQDPEEEEWTCEAEVEIWLNEEKVGELTHNFKEQ